MVEHKASLFKKVQTDFSCGMNEFTKRILWRQHVDIIGSTLQRMALLKMQVYLEFCLGFVLSQILLRTVQ